mmetsp:Transcript_54094/g.127756  ORF Transcript_54094/g.127756 Transcript_54094/m.127756 type:complete len:244 (+) Transcript_54094:1929-2660(+)
MSTKNATQPSVASDKPGGRFDPFFLLGVVGLVRHGDKGGRSVRCHEHGSAVSSARHNELVVAGDNGDATARPTTDLRVALQHLYIHINDGRSQRLAPVVRAGVQQRCHALPQCGSAERCGLATPVAIEHDETIPHPPSESRVTVLVVMFALADVVVLFAVLRHAHHACPRANEPRFILIDLGWWWRVHGEATRCKIVAIEQTTAPQPLRRLLVELHAVEKPSTSHALHGRELRRLGRDWGTRT